VEDAAARGRVLLDVQGFAREISDGGERRSIRMAGPRGDGAAAVDLGINILASAATNSGAWLLYRGSRARRITSTSLGK